MSKSAGQREQTKKERVNTILPPETSLSCESEPLKEKRDSTDCKVISGTLHQGDVRFCFPGIQCTYLSFYALVTMKMKNPQAWNASDIDSCIIQGNDRFIEHCSEQEWQPKMLLVNELPQVINIHGTVFECYQSDIDIATGTLVQPTTDISNAISSALADAVFHSFEQSDSCLLVCGGQTIAIAKRENNFFVFDPHSRGMNGLQHPSGNAVLVSFHEIQNMIGFIKRLLIDSLQLKTSEQFELVPLAISEKRNSKIINILSTSCSTSASPNIDRQSCLNQFTQPCVEPLAAAHKLQDLSSDQTQASSKFLSPAIDAYFADQKERQVKYREQRFSKQNVNNCNKDARKDYMRHYMKKKRENEYFRKQDNTKAAERMKRALSTEEGRQKHNKQSAQTMKKMLDTDEGRQRHNKRSAEGMRNMLRTDEGRQKHNESSAKVMQNLLSTEEGRLKHNERSAKGMHKFLSTEEGRQKHNERSAKGMQKLLSTDEGRQKHNERSAEGMQKILTTKEGRQRHNKRSAEGMQKILKTEEGRQKHRKRTAEGMQKLLSTEEGRQKHTRKSAERMQKILSTKKGRQRHNKSSCETMKKYRNTLEGSRSNRTRSAEGMKHLRRNKEYTKKEHLSKQKRRFGQSLPEAVGKFNEAMRSGSSFVCSSCHQTWFKQSVRDVSSLSKMASLDVQLLNNCLTGYLSVANCEWICNTCLFNIKKGKIPKLSVINGMKFPRKPPELNLSNLEERLISLRIPFMQIRALNSGGQFSLKGSIVNVPADIEPTIQALPRFCNQSETIPVKLKKMKEFKHAVATENVRPLAVMTALQTLLNTSQLYKEANISVHDKWNVDDSEEVIVDSSNTQQTSDSDSDTFSETGDDDTPLMTLLDEHGVDKNQILSVAPGEGQKPLSIFKDKNAEYLAFPTLFCGQKRVDNSERHVQVYYSDICKWELRCVDRRVALHIPNMFYKMKRLQIEQVSGKVHLAVRRCKTKGKSYTAGYILRDNMGESLVRLDEGYKIFRTIRNSPQYWENQKKDVFAMIRQLGIPTLFLSLSANDLHWPELIVALGKLVDNKDYSDEVENNTLSWEIRSHLVQSDPVTCVRHFDHRVSQFIETVLKSPHSPLGILQDFFYRVEFQQRGSPHIHMLAWMQGAPKYGENEDTEVLEYVDRVATCSSDVPDDLKEILNFQRHKHSRTCRKTGKPVCRFGIPFPPMRETTIIQPYTGDERSVYEEHYKIVHQYLNTLERDISFDDFLKEVDLSHDEYIKAVQTSVKTEKIFLQRRPIEGRINPYMKNLLGVWKANHDIQYVLDAYACAMYIVSYINKSSKGMSTLMAEACKEARKGNKSLKESVRHIGNKFLNAVEVSAQEAAYLILQLNMSTKSRKCEFVSTNPQSERTFLLKTKKELEELPKDSTDIEADNIIKRYKRRHEALENYCLADFISKVVSVSRIPRKTIAQTHDNSETEDFFSDEDENDEDYENEVPQDELGNMSKVRISVVKGNFRIFLRTKPKIIRYVNFNKKIDSENYYREQLMLFYPWRNEESDLLNGHKTYQDHFSSVHETIQSKKKEYDPNSDFLDEVEAAAETQTINIFDDVCPNIESVEAKDGEKEPLASTKYAFYNPETRSHAFYDLGPDLGLFSDVGNDDQELVQHRLPEKDYLELISKLNEKQKEIFTHIVHSITFNPEKQLCLFITGGAGVGKSVVIRTLYQSLHRLCGSKVGQDPEDIRILLCAYTGLAAYNIQGSTLHNAFCIEPNKKLQYKALSDDKRNTLKTKYRCLSVLIIDEVSMVGNAMLNFLYLRLQEIKGNREPFGGVHMILVGDLFQLRPVGDGWIFVNNSGNYASLAPNLWQTYFSMFELTEIMRQKNDTQFAELLNRIREGRQTQGDINVLISRNISPESTQYLELKNILHLFPCNISVDAHNMDVYERATSQKAEIKCTDTVLGEDSNEVKEKILEQLKGRKSNDTGNLCERLKVAVGLSYVTTHNILVSDGICNGTPCILQKIHYIEKNNPIPSCLWVEFPEKRIGKETRKENMYYYHKYRDISKTWTPIWAVRRTFMFRRKAIVRQQFPLKASSAKTIHKAQGQTESCIIVDMTLGSRPHQHYVAFSRVTSLQGLYLLNGLSGRITVDKSVVREMERLRRDACVSLCYKPVQTYHCDLVTVFQNSQSLRLHFPLVRNNSTFTDADIICLAETRLQQSDKDEDYSIEGFHPIIRNDQKAKSDDVRPPHGLAVFVKRCHEIVSLSRISTEKFESLVLNVRNMYSLNVYTVIVVYKAPTCSFESFKTSIMSLSELQQTDRLIIVGDFNFDVSQNQNKTFLRVMKQNFPTCRQLYTSFTTQENTILDIAFNSSNRGCSDIIACVWSYHHTLVVSVF